MTQPTDPADGRHPDEGSTAGATPSSAYGSDSSSTYGSESSSSYGAPAYPSSGGDQYGAPAYQGGGYQQVPQQAPKNGLGIAALVLGILAILSCFTIIGGILFGIIAIVLGFVGRGRAKKGLATNGGVALAGIITGVLGLLAAIAIVVAGVSIFNSVGGGDLISCVSDAGGDQARVQQCQDEFSNQLDLPTT